MTVCSSALVVKGLLTSPWEKLAVHHVFAYLDPGSGSLILQATIGTVAAVSYMLRRKLASIVNSVLGRNQNTDPATAEPNDPAR
jgi:hypothetical protein